MAMIKRYFIFPRSSTDPIEIYFGQAIAKEHIADAREITMEEARDWAIQARTNSGYSIVGLEDIKG